MDIDTTTLWKQVLADLEKSVSKANFFTFFKSTALLSLDKDSATIAAPSLIVIDLLKKRFSAEIKAALDAQTKRNLTLVFIPKHILSEKINTPTGPLFENSVPSQPTTVGHLPRVRPEYTFENFAVSPSTNELAFASATTVANHIGTSYNPFFIYGPVGVGKTHLMHAIANHVYQKTPERKIIYITSEEFTNEVIDAIRNNDTARMKKRFRTSSLLLIDDIQFIEGKERVQEELFHTFNILIDNNSQICLSSDRPPQEIKKIEKRLSSRFAGGLTVDISPPDFELKTAILQKKAEKFGHELPIEVAKILADSASDTRTLEGLLTRVISQAMIENSPISIELAKKALGQQIQEKREHLYADDIIKAVCVFYDVKSTQLKGPKRDAGLVRARQVTMFLLKHELGLTLMEIGNILGGRDHTTIMYGVGKMEKLTSDKTMVAEDIAGITLKLHG